MTDPKSTPATPPVISDAALDDAVGGIGTGFISETEKQRQRAGDGSVRPATPTTLTGKPTAEFASQAGGSPNV